MSPNRDPFELMARFVDPEPDPILMKATIAQSRAAFASRAMVRARPNSVLDWLRQSSSWLAPVGVAAAAFTLVVMLAPALNPASQTVPADREIVADRPISAPPAGETTLSRGSGQLAIAPPSNSGNRMGMTQSSTGQRPIEKLPQLISFFEGDGLRIGLRLDVEALEIYLPDISGERTIDAQNVMPGEQIEVLAAFAQPDKGLIALQIRVDDVRSWRIYRLIDGNYGRDPERSTRVSNAPDRAEVERRLAAD